VGRPKRLDLLGSAGVRERVHEVVERVLVVDVNPRLRDLAVPDVHDDHGSPRMRLAVSAGGDCQELHGVIVASETVVELACACRRSPMSG
jgi:hypothetical protein